MIARLRGLARGMILLARRFLDNQPKNKYEDIVFNMIRTGALQFGRERIVTP